MQNIISKFSWGKVALASYGLTSLNCGIQAVIDEKPHDSHQSQRFMNEQINYLIPFVIGITLLPPGFLIGKVVKGYEWTKGDSQ
jgi:hypothetical protein